MLSKEVTSYFKYFSIFLIYQYPLKSNTTFTFSIHSLPHYMYSYN